jgi:alkylation response protein AidB-like acyl-CoA dehydrogenase
VHGFKWFSSATDSDMTLLLARQHDPLNDEVGGGSRGLSLFYTEIRDPAHPEAPKDATFTSTHRPLNKIRIQRLKEKLGTKPVPTAELELIGSTAHMVGTPGRGVATIATILNVTRVHCAVGSTSFVARAWNTVRSWAWKREASGKRLVQLPLHLVQLAQVGLGYRACSAFSFYVVALLGKTEWDWYQARCKVEGPLTVPVVCEDAQDALLLRFLTPIAKTWVARTAVQVIGEAMECLGGQGYMEDATDIPRLWRDAQVNCIWEGTTSVMSLDVLRVLKGSKGQAWSVYEARMLKLIGPSTGDEHSQEQLKKALQILAKLAGMIVQGDEVVMERSAREFTFAVGRVTAGCLLYDLSLMDAAAKVASQRWNISADILLGPCLHQVGLQTVQQGTLPLDNMQRGDILLGLGVDLDMTQINSRL